MKKRILLAVLLVVPFGIALAISRPRLDAKYETMVVDRPTLDSQSVTTGKGELGMQSVTAQERDARLDTQTGGVSLGNPQPGGVHARVPSSGGISSGVPQSIK